MITLNLISKYLNDWWLNVHSKIHNPKSAYLFLYLFTNKILFKKKLFILLFYYIIYRICKLFSVIHFLYSYICGPYICNLNMWHNLSSDSPLCYMMKPTTSYPTPLPFSTPLSLLHKICNPIEFFVSHLISLNTFVYLVSLNIAGGPRGGWGMWVGTTA